MLSLPFLYGDLVSNIQESRQSDSMDKPYQQHLGKLKRKKKTS